MKLGLGVFLFTSFNQLFKKPNLRGNQHWKACYLLSNWPQGEPAEFVLLRKKKKKKKQLPPCWAPHTPRTKANPRRPACLICFLDFHLSHWNPQESTVKSNRYLFGGPATPSFRSKASLGSSVLGTHKQERKPSMSLSCTYKTNSRSV